MAETNKREVLRVVTEMDEQSESAKDKSVLENGLSTKIQEQLGRVPSSRANRALGPR